MKIVVATAWDELYQPLADIAVPIMENYCKRHGYTLAAWKGGYHTNESDLLGYGDRCKVTMYKAFYDVCDAFVWLDVDTVIMNSALPVIKPMYAEMGPSFLWTYDVNGPCSGFFYARCIPKVHMFLSNAQHKSVAMVDDKNPLGQAIQDGMKAVGSTMPGLEVSREITSCKDAGHCYFDYDYYGWGAYKHIGQYEPGDWLVTFPSVPLERRIELMAQYAKEAK